MIRFLKVILLAISGMLLISGGEFTYLTSIKKDGSGSLTLEYETAENCESSVSAILSPPGATLVVTNLEDRQLCTFETPFSDLEELQALYPDWVSVNQLEIIDEKVLIFDISVKAENELENNLVAIDSLSWVLTLPGPVLSHNADAIENNTLTWNLSMSTTARLQAEGDVFHVFDYQSDMGLVETLLCCLSLLVLIGGGAGVFLILRSRNANGNQS